MKVLVTGGTGLVGSHTAAALLRDGHEVRLLVRRPERIARTFRPFATEPTEVMVGDANDREAVHRAIDGCDAVLHAAATVALKRSDAERVNRLNTQAAETVLELASAARLDPIISVSSVSVFDLDESVVTVNSPLSSVAHGYSRAKCDAERFARGMQVAGAPVTITYPGGVFGPIVPGATLPAMHQAAISWIRDRWVLPSGLNLVDVRDVAAAHVAMMRPGRGPRRFMLGGHFVRWGELADILDEMTGRAPRRRRVPGAVMRGLGRVAEAAPVRAPVDFELTREAMENATRMVPVDSTPTLDTLGIVFRDRWSTIADTYRWLVAEGHVDPQWAGRLNVTTPEGSITR
ncbi:MAG: NAD-dependent epimerase/dehydratase family protein [Candidatus Microthrix sp.]|uniref:Putative NAD-dependent epimerase/dehydratase n=1 Tax=Candidatus Neomicrothrix parvicella RN1 TaxID=1229780 RepID=R4Z796_9ACTN|nr:MULTISPECIES: NAD-dependent epimerase/dehydratase family protein [Microthrix]MBK7322003.1 NAD-dependent epimerase/dehydratase family protein [Candidatus Microthrix sp.]CCM66026.1 putative NAD-dependent epimerase/dehydratase [Candidatus Microthrix parvicella RN1]